MKTRKMFIALLFVVGLLITTKVFASAHSAFVSCGGGEGIYMTFSADSAQEYDKIMEQAHDAFCGDE